MSRAAVKQMLATMMQISRIPPALVRLAVPLCRPLNPRLAALLDFGLKVTQADIVAPCYGTRRLGDYLRSVTGSVESGRSSLRP